MREDAREAEVWGVGDAARNLERLGRVGLDAAAVIAAIDFQKEVERDARAPRGLVEQRAGSGRRP